MGVACRDKGQGIRVKGSRDEGQGIRVEGNSDEE